MCYVCMCVSCDYPYYGDVEKAEQQTWYAVCPEVLAFSNCPNYRKTCIFDDVLRNSLCRRTKNNSASATPDVEKESIPGRHVDENYRWCITSVTMVEKSSKGDEFLVYKRCERDAILCYDLKNYIRT